MGVFIFYTTNEPDLKSESGGKSDFLIVQNLRIKCDFATVFSDD